MAICYNLIKMNERKDNVIQIRISTEDKQKIQKDAEGLHMTISEFLFFLWQKFMEKTK